jgi:uncharacterized DUF497 family protein
MLVCLNIAKALAYEVNNRKIVKNTTSHEISFARANKTKPNKTKQTKKQKTSQFSERIPVVGLVSHTLRADGIQTEWNDKLNPRSSPKPYNISKQHCESKLDYLRIKEDLHAAIIFRIIFPSQIQSTIRIARSQWNLAR